MTTQTWYLGLRRGRKRLENFLVNNRGVSRKSAKKFMRSISPSIGNTINLAAHMADAYDIVKAENGNTQAT